MTMEFLEDTGRPCYGCGKELDDSYPYELCDECQRNKSCPHGVPYTEVCNQCCVESDFAFDANRERGR